MEMEKEKNAPREEKKTLLKEKSTPVTLFGYGKIFF